MATLLSASIYGMDNGYNSYDSNMDMGVMRGFPTSLITIEPLTTPTAYSGVTCNSIISVLPTGNNVNPTKWYTPATYDALLALANAADA